MLLIKTGLCCNNKMSIVFVKQQFLKYYICPEFEIRDEVLIK